MKNYYLLVLALLFCTCHQQSALDKQLIQSINRLSELNKSKSSDTLILRGTLDSGYKVALKVSNLQHDSLFAAVSRLYGNALYNIDATKAQTVYQMGLSIGLRQLRPTDNTIFRLYINKAQLYYSQRDYKKALIYFDSVKINSQAANAQMIRLNFMTMIANCYMYLDESESSLKIMSDIKSDANSLYSQQQLIEFYTNYALYLKLQKKYEEATQKIKLGETIIEKLKSDNSLTAVDSILWANLAFEQGHIFQEYNDFNKSEKYFLKAQNIFLQQHDIFNYIYTLRNLGSLYFKMQELDKAESVLTKGLNLWHSPELDVDKVRLKFGLLSNRGEVYLKKQQYQKAITDIDSAIYLFNLYEQRPSLTTTMLQARNVLMELLANKTKALTAIADLDKNTERYQKALKMADEIVQIADDVRTDYFSDNAKMSLATDTKPYLDFAIGICQKLYTQTHDAQYLQRAFGFVEYSRSMVLYENARLSNQLPPELKAENEALKTKEAALLSKNNVEDLQRYLQQKRQFREKIKSLNRNQLASTAALQAELLHDDQTAFIEYFVGDSSIFVFCLLKNDLKLVEIKKPKDFDKQIETLRNEITQPHPTSYASNFEVYSSALYEQILRGSLETLSPTVSKLIIAPDGVLAYLPFDILTYQRTIFPDDGIDVKARDRMDFRHSSYLFQKYQISYAYSANLLLEQKRAKKGDASRLFAGFAPRYDDKDTLLFSKAIASRAVLTREGAYELKGAKDEVKAISNLVGGNAFVNEAATERSFRIEAERYKILHFAMHSLMDDKEPMLSKLLFTLSPKDTTQDGDMTAAELYTMHLNADLAVLSACNTGYGKLSRGEGVMSLARAFTYAGVPATVTSLWKVPDMTTREIMVAFYKNLKAGMTKDAALREAKLTYLKNAPESIAANPYFWAGFVPMGNMEAMDMSERGPLSIFWILVGLMVLMGVGWWYFRKKKNA